ncbi:hypothetical protein Tco_1206582, partial [Tanacetum coccineum]
YLEHSEERLCLADTVYHLWIERNTRLFHQQEKSSINILKQIFGSVSSKLMTLRVKSSSAVKEVEVKWGIILMKVNSINKSDTLWYGFNPTGFNGKASLPSMLCKPEAFGHVLNECPKKIDSDVLKKMKTPRQAVKGVLGGLKMMFKLTKQVYQGVFKKNRASLSGKKKQTGLTREEVSNSNPFDVLITVENDNELRTNGGNSNLVEKGANNDVVCSTHATSPVAFGGPTITPLVEWINDLERQMLDGMPSTSMREQVEDSNSDIEDLVDETTRYLASTNQAGGGGWAFGHVLNECPKKIDSDVLKKMKTPRQVVKGVHGGLKMMFKLTKQVYQGVFKKNRASLSGKKKQTGLTREEVSNSNPFDALITVENDNELRTNGGNSNLVEKGANNDVVCSTHATSPVAFGGPTITPLVEWINDLERQMLDG